MLTNNFIKTHYKELLEILDCIKVGVFVADANGTVLMLNKESEKTGGMSREELCGKNMHELIKMGYVTESSILKAIESKKEENIIQELGEGGQLYITGVPFSRKGEIELIICTERDITETINLKELLKEKEKMTGKYETELEYLRKINQDTEEKIISNSIEMKNILEKALRIAQLNTTVLLSGESGTGKELVANYIYKNSARVNFPFIKVNCAAIPENLLESEFFGYEKGSFTGANKNGKIGIFELAQEGTLFLDEIADLPIHMQSKLLRVLQEKEITRIGGIEVIPVDVRIIAASNMNLRKAIEDGRFREDLYYRLNTIPIEIPPLRQRRVDIEPLVGYFINKYNKKYKMKKTILYDALEVLQKYDWPGNVRELSNIIERIIVSYDGDRITKFQVQKQIINEQLQEDKTEEYTGSFEEIMEQYEKKLLSSMLNKYGKASDIAKALNVNKSTISRKLKKFKIKSE